MVYRQPEEGLAHPDPLLSGHVPDVSILVPAEVVPGHQALQRVSQHIDEHWLLHAIPTGKADSDQSYF